MFFIDLHTWLYFEYLLLFCLKVYPSNSTEFKPPIIMFTITVFSQHNVNCAPIIRKQNIMRNTKLNQFVSNKTKYKRQWISDLRWLVVLTQRWQHQSMTHWCINLFNSNPNIIQIYLLLRIHQSTLLPLHSLFMLNW